MTINERSIVEGGGSQTGNWSGRSRWGDYSAMCVDPSSPTTFWYTNEYYTTTSSSTWQTRIGSFTFGNVFSSAASATPAILCSTSSDSIQLFAYAYGGTTNYTYSWTSIPPGFTSTVNNPKVRPPESTLYIVTVSDGPETRQDTVAVRIVPKPTVITGSDTIVCWYTSSIPLYATADHYNRVAWGTTGDGNFSDAFVLNTEYFPGMQDKTSGQVDLMLLVQPISPCTGNIMKIKHVTLDPCTGIDELSGNDIQCDIQPNPAHDRVKLTLTGKKGQPIEVSVISTTGQTIQYLEMPPSANQVVKILDISKCPEGIYLIRVKSGSQTKTVRLVVQ
jgi:hypothetical protein